MRLLNINLDIFNNRIVWVDWAKFLAIFAILIVHCSSDFLMSNVIGSGNWLVAVFFESLTRWGVLVFIMVSGFLLLRKEYDLREFIFKRFKRVVLPFVLWNIVYIIVKIVFQHSLTDMGVLSVIFYFIAAFLDPTIITVQFWFVYMILGLYLVTPIISDWVRNADDLHINYFLIVWIIILLINFFNIKFLLVNYLGFFAGYLGLFVLGYYIPLKKSKGQLKYLDKPKTGIILFLIGLLGNFIGTWALSALSGQMSFVFLNLGDLTPFTLLEAIGIFAMILNFTPKIKSKLSNYIAVKVSLASFGIYLVNVLVINMMEKVGIYSGNLNSFSIILFAILTLIISYIIIIIFDEIPILKKFSGMS